MNKKKSFIIIQGAQSTGKSTLINELKSKFPHFNIISQVARSVILQQKITNQELQNNINGCFEQLQYKILLAQFKKQNQFLENEEEGVCILDRCVISPLVYSLFYFKDKKQLSNKIEQGNEFKQRVDEYKKNAIIILLHPQLLILKSDGVRKQSTFKQLQEINQIYIQVLNKYEIKYYEIKQLLNRCQIVQAVLKKQLEIKI